MLAKPSFTYLLTLFVSCITFSCNKLEYSPNQSFSKNSASAINAKNIAKLAKQQSADDTLRFILTGDTQRSYDQATALVKLVNSKFPKLDFVILSGDISDFGLLQEMVWVTDIYNGLQVPYLAVIGNHDLIANGRNVYLKMFGDLNFTFTHKGVKFICHDDNSREYQFNGNVPDLTWIAQELQTSNEVEAIVGVAHIPPRGGDFDPAMEDAYIHLFNAPKVVACLFAHENKSDLYYPIAGGVPFIVTDAVTNRECLYVEIVNGKLFKNENITY
ncbi:metallophosphoesterase [Pedobacter aquae]|uniref:Metallophosphoesterase n=1 Tax=Pedobacter aquae TaxID=2605747 RepID=A0A5C0VG59_9SPHI|nr:metallophosphoesterase [Pedobacter aquae]QEK51655.1 metallophosphoesterase [Pedobacter aquae]